MVDDRAKQLSVVLRREVAKIRSLEAECIEANKATIFSGVSMTVNLQHAQIKYSSLAQLAERMTVNHDVAGSSPAGGANEKAGRKTCFFRWLPILVSNQQYYN